MVRAQEKHQKSGKNELGAKNVPKMDHFLDIIYFVLTNFGLFLPILVQIQHSSHSFDLSIVL